MIKHLITRYNDGQGNEQDVKITLYDDGLEISSLDESKPLHLYWLSSKLQRLNGITQHSLSTLTYRDNPNVRLIIEDPGFVEALSNQLPNLKVGSNRQPSKWRIRMISFAILGLLGIIILGIFWQTTKTTSTAIVQPSSEQFH
ncbi:MAG: hypothetical protein U1E78_06295 [Gammaproteobacteria bacterium]